MHVSTKAVSTDNTSETRLVLLGQRAGLFPLVTNVSFCSLVGIPRYDCARAVYRGSWVTVCCQHGGRHFDWSTGPNELRLRLCTV